MLLMLTLENMKDLKSMWKLLSRNQKKEDKIKLKQNEKIKIRIEINKIKTRKLIKINKSNSWFFEKINKVDKILPRLMKKKERRHH